MIVVINVGNFSSGFFVGNIDFTVTVVLTDWFYLHPADWGLWLLMSNIVNVMKSFVHEININFSITFPFNPEVDNKFHGVQVGLPATLVGVRQ